MRELKPCPFCGGEAEIGHSNLFSGKMASYCECNNCGATGEYFDVSSKYSSDDKAIEAWNRRVEHE